MAAAVLILWMIFTTSDPADAKVKIFFYDPDSNLKNIAGLKSIMQSYFNDVGEQIEFQPFTKQEIFEAELEKQAPDFVIVSSLYFLSTLRAKGMKPILIPIQNGKPYYHKVLVTNQPSISKENLNGKSLATTLGGDQGREWLEKNVLSEVNTKVDDIRMISVTKDIDALLALGFYQVDTALVSPRNIEILRSVNPLAVKDLKIILNSKPIVFPPLCTTRSDIDPVTVQKITEIFLNMQNHPLGIKTLKILGFDQWSPEIKDIFARED